MKLVPLPNLGDSPKRLPLLIPNAGFGIPNRLGGTFSERAGELKDPIDDPKMLSLGFIFPDLVKRASGEFFDLEPSWELPNTVDGGGPCGVKEFAADGGGPAGVVETSLRKL